MDDALMVDFGQVSPLQLFKKKLNVCKGGITNAAVAGDLGYERMPAIEALS